MRLVRFGTNINHQQNYEQAKRLLFALYGNVKTDEPQYSRDYNAAPDDEDAAIYLNFNAQIESPLSDEELKAQLKDLERRMGRTPERKAQGIIDADLDLVQSFDLVQSAECRVQSASAQPNSALCTLHSALIMIILFVQSTIAQPNSALCTLHSALTPSSALAQPTLHSALCTLHFLDDKEQLTRAIEYFNDSKFHEAGLILRKLNKTYKLNSRFKAYLALCEYHEWNYKEALKGFDEIKAELTNYYPHERSVYYFAAAESAFNLEDYRAAIPYYELALTVCYDKEKGETYYRLGFCHLLTGDRPTAKLLFEQSLRHYRQHPTGKDDTARIRQLTNMIKGLSAVPHDSIP